MNSPWSWFVQIRLYNEFSEQCCWQGSLGVIGTAQLDKRSVRLLRICLPSMGPARLTNSTSSAHSILWLQLRFLIRTAGLPLGYTHTLSSGRPPTDGTGPPGSLAGSRVAGCVSNSASVCGESAIKRIHPYMKHPRWLINHKHVLIFSVTHKTLRCNRILRGDYFWPWMWVT